MFFCYHSVLVKIFYLNVNLLLSRWGLFNYFRARRVVDVLLHHEIWNIYIRLILKLFCYQIILNYFRYSRGENFRIIYVKSLLHQLLRVLRRRFNYKFVRSLSKIRVCGLLIRLCALLFNNFKRVLLNSLFYFIEHLRFSETNGWLNRNLFSGAS